MSMASAGFLGDLLCRDGSYGEPVRGTVDNIYGGKSLESQAAYLRLLMSSIGNLEEFAVFIAPDDDGAAGALLCSLQTLRSRLESWAAHGHPLPPLGPGGISWALDRPQPSLETDSMLLDVLTRTQTWDCNLITSASAAAALPVPRVSSTNTNHLHIPVAAEQSYQQPGPIGGELWWCMPSSLTIQDGEFPAALCEREMPCEKSPGSARSCSSSQLSNSPPPSTGETGQPLFPHIDTNSGLLSWLADIILEDTFDNIVHIEHLPKLSWSSLAIPDNDLTDYQYRGVTYQPAYVDDVGCFTHLLVADDAFKFQLPPPIDAPDDRPTDEICMRFLESLALEATREGSVPYLVGPPLDPRWNGLVDAGEGLRSQLPYDIKGITTPYWYLGGRFSGTAFHKEDCDLRSMNLVIYGVKLWIIVDTQDTERFEMWVRRIWGNDAGNDDQWLRHLHLVLPPSMLEAANIKFRLISARPGDMIVISPKQYHYAINMTPSLAIAINFLLPEEPISKEPTLLCDECGICPFVNYVPNLSVVSNASPGGSLKRSCVEPHSRRSPKRRQQFKATDPNHNDAEEDVRRAAVIKRLQAPPACCLAPVFPGTNLPSSKVIRLAMAMRGRSAIAQVWKLHQSIRSGRSADISGALIDRSLSGNTQKAALDQGIVICTGANQQSNLLRRLLTWHFSEAVELSKGPTAMRASSTTVTQYTGENPRSRYSKLKYRGDLLYMICGSHRGLLPFIPLQRDDDCGISDPESQYQYSATKKEFKDFEKIFQVNDVLTQVLCAIGASFLDSWGYKDPCDFKYKDWLYELQQDFNEEVIRSMSERLGRGVCGCGNGEKTTT
ncbi:putative transcription factor jumonji [Rosellinia necatrix]|uniref:Putative transcription factor jumonji n=1 Tax=Rosellinia necatrix TaxID=77044 RepID=A0A1W2TJC4_ROSNE|nr:putative transcription factor jumonji [Rosellinia necatrix]